MKLEMKIRGKKVVFEGTPNEMVRLSQKLNNENIMQQSEVKEIDLPAPEEVTQFIEEQNSFSHSMSELIKKFFNAKSSSEIGRKAYYYIYRTAEQSRKFLSKKYNGQFTKQSIPAENGKSTVIKATVYTFEPNTSNS